MANSKAGISFLQLFMLMMLFNGLISHVIVNPVLLDAAGRDAWISVLLTAVLYLPWCALVVYIMRKSNGQKLQPWLAQQTTPLLSWLMLAPIGLQLYLIGIMTLLHTTIWTVANYLPATPQYVLIIVTIVISHYTAIHGIRTIAIGSGILLPLVVCLGYFVSIANTSDKDWFMLKPFLEQGWKPVFNGMLFAGAAFCEITLVLLLQHQLKTKVKVWQMTLLGLVLVYITLGPIVGAITEFGPKEAAKQMVSPYEQWRLVKIGSYIEHVDFLSVFQWLSGAMVRISLAQFLLADLLPFRKTQSRNRFTLIITLSYIVLAIVMSRYHSFYLEMFEKYLIISLFAILTLTSIWIVIAWFAKPFKEGTL